VNYEPGPLPVDDKFIREYLWRELRKLAASVRDSAAVVFYRTNVETELSLSAGDSANYKVGLSSNVTRISTSVTVTITGLADITPYRERTLINVGTGVLVLKSEASESSASYRFALPQDWQISANGAATLWFDPISSRHRGLSKT
jgi:hypothetical protein